jgi:nucleoid-associated protein YgaU
MIHTIKMGETLKTIAQKYYGDPSKSTKIYNANRSSMGHPDNVVPGAQIVVPK